MKTKIVYISGNELFDMADIRAAFNEVRAALSLGSDTVLFGVPVDDDDALASNPPVVEPVVDITPVQPEPVEPVIEGTPRITRKSPKVVPISPTVDLEPEPEPVVEPRSGAVNDTPTVVPILSVLGSKPSDDTDDDSPEIEEIVEPDTANIESDIVINEPMVESESVTISDMIADEAPTPEHEKTLEELLESMTPLGEDAEKPFEPSPVSDDIEPNSNENETENDTDATLEKLANEFVENQGKISTPVKPSSRGKIGKLKNILPFKKAKHDDSGLMGDLFGWAGVAANDEDLTVPGFFK